MTISGKKLLAGLLGAFVVYNGAKWAWGEAAEAYFKYRCEQDAGEFIYRTVENVEGVFQMRPRDPRDYFDRLRKRDIPEDPYGHTNVEAQRPWDIFFVESENKYHFFETTKEPEMGGYESNIDHMKYASKPVFTGEKYWRYQRSNSPYQASRYLIYREAIQSSKLKSKFGYTWRGVRNRWDRLFKVWGGETMVVELVTKDVLAVKRGFVLANYYSNKGDICPRDKNDGYFIYDFISRVLKPIKKET